MAIGTKHSEPSIENLTKRENVLVGVGRKRSLLLKLNSKGSVKLFKDFPNNWWEKFLDFSTGAQQGVTGTKLSDARTCDCV